MHLRILVLSAVASAVAFGQVSVSSPTALGGAGDAYQVRYASNLNIADSEINLTNTGAFGAGLFYGQDPTITGTICVNVYAFAPDEQMVACCSCPVTPDAIVSLSVYNDILHSTSGILSQQSIPNSLAIKLLATIPGNSTAGTVATTSGACKNSSWNGSTAGGTTNSAFTAAQLAPGMLAFGTTIHTVTTLTSPVTTTEQLGETRFEYGALSTGEAVRLQQLCMFINANGSGYGICNSCKQGGLAATKK